MPLCFPYPFRVGGNKPNWLTQGQWAGLEGGSGRSVARVTNEVHQIVEEIH